MANETGNFRGKLFGGFNRQDVINYIASTAADYNSCEKQLDGLREEHAGVSAERDDLSYQVEKLTEDLDALRTENEELTRKNEELTAQLAAFDHNSPTDAEMLKKAESMVADLLDKCASMKSDMDINFSHSRADASHLFTEAGDRLSELRNDIISMMESCSEGTD